MAKTYKTTGAIRFFNGLMKIMIRLGLAPKNMHILTVRGRASGRRYSTPVSLIQEDGQRWLVAPYGEVSWVKNARAAGELTLTRGGKSETLTFTELGPEESAPILKRYLQREAITRPYFDVRPDSPLDDFAKEADRHPVFLLRDKA
jgi:deazaflavin-dependent oxidoreductase (nitroreductase family)